jgi:hypothetical protein
MKVFGKSVSEYVSFTKWILWLIALVGAARLALSLAGLPNSEVKWLSVTAMWILGVVYCAVRVPTKGFGGYKHLLPLLVLQGAVESLIIAGAIMIAMARGVDNIYSAPEYSGGGDGKTWQHVGAHFLLGFVLGPLVFWLIAAGIMFVVKKVSSAGSTGSSAVPSSNS